MALSVEKEAATKKMATARKHFKVSVAIGLVVLCLLTMSIGANAVAMHILLEVRLAMLIVGGDRPMTP